MRCKNAGPLFTAGALLLGAVLGCSGAPTAIEGKGGARGSGGQEQSGGTPGSGGSGSGGSGGTSESGGSAGGQSGSGGTSSSGGTVNSGGTSSSGGEQAGGRSVRPDGSSGSVGGRGMGGTTRTSAGTGGTSDAGGTPGTGGRAGTGGSPGTGGRPGTGGAPGTGGSTSDFDWGTTSYNANGGSGVAYQGHFTGQTCINPTCHRHNISYGGTIYQSNGSSTAGNVQIGIRIGSNLTTTYSGSQGNFYGNLSGASWSTAQIAIRTASGTAIMPANASASGECNSCHGSSNRIVVP